ncbi:MAG: hypothetical protein P8010_22165 [Desulfosarcinaceae bacterium]|jgi:hypothetical protein
MKAGVILALTLTAMALLWSQGAITTRADDASTAQITFYVH